MRDLIAVWPRNRIEFYTTLIRLVPFAHAEQEDGHEEDAHHVPRDVADIVRDAGPPYLAASIDPLTACSCS